MEPTPRERLPFHLLLWIAGADEHIEADEVDVFHRMLERRSWCKSAAFSELLPRASEVHESLWQAYQRGDLKRQAALLEQSLSAAAQGLSDAQLPAFAQDVRHLAQSLARAAGGFLGLGAINHHEQQALRDLGSLLDTLPARLQGLQTVPAAAPTQTPERWTQGRIRMRCVQARMETQDTRSLVLVPEEPMELSFLPGQFVTLELELEGKRVQRSYTIASSAQRSDSLEITVKRVPGGKVSEVLVHDVEPGWRVSVRGPYGKFTCLPSVPKKLLMISGGSGITPVMAMARWLRDTKTACDVVFLHSAKTQGDLVFRAELEAMAQSLPSFRLLYTLTRQEPCTAWTGHVGRLDERMLMRLVPDCRHRTAYVCGPTAFMENVRDSLKGCGFPMEHYHSESFGGALRGELVSRPKLPSLQELLPQPEKLSVLEGSKQGREGTESSELPRVVVFARSGREITPDESVHLLDLAEQVGVSIPNACRTGVCGTCKVRKRSGDVKMSTTEGLGGPEHAEDQVLACVGIACGRVVLDV